MEDPLDDIVLKTQLSPPLSYVITDKFLLPLGDAFHRILTLKYIVHRLERSPYPVERPAQILRFWCLQLFSSILLSTRAHMNSEQIRAEALKSLQAVRGGVDAHRRAIDDIGSWIELRLLSKYLADPLTRMRRAVLRLIAVDFNTTTTDTCIVMEDFCTGLKMFALLAESLSNMHSLEAAIDNMAYAANDCMRVYCK